MTLSNHPFRTTLACLATFLTPLLPARAQTAAPFSNHLVPVGSAAAAKGNDETSEPVRDGLQQGMKPPILLIGREGGEVLSQAQKAVREAEKHFQYGKFYIQEGKKEDARREFDLAIDILLDVPETAPDRTVVEKKFEELSRLIYRYDIDSLDSGVSKDNPVYVQSPLPGLLDQSFPVDPRQKDKALAQMASTPSELPLVVNDAVLSFINYFTSERGSKVLYAGLKRSGRYKDMISRILDEEGVPQELIYLAQAESAFVPRAVSLKAAAGMWQFVRSRGGEYGLESTKESDERLDPEKATRAAARHLRDLYKQLGDWHLAMAAYNCGPYCVERAVQRTGYADFWELRTRRVLPKETMNYVPAILAMAIVSKNLQNYGLQQVQMDSAIEYDTVKMSAPTSLALIADAADLPVSEIRELNPSLLKTTAPSGYTVRVPKSRGSLVLASLDSVPEEKRLSWRLHKILDGETLASIARQYSTAPDSIVAANSRLGTTFFSSPERGEMLLIPTAPRPEPAVKGASQARSRNVRSYAGTKRGTARVASISVKSKSQRASR